MINEPEKFFTKSFIIEMVLGAVFSMVLIFYTLPKAAEKGFDAGYALAEKENHVDLYVLSTDVPRDEKTLELYAFMFNLNYPPSSFDWMDNSID